MTLFARFKNPIHLYQLRPYLHLSIHHSYHRCYLLCHHHPVSILLFLPIDDHGHNLVPENISVKTRTYISTNDHILNIAVHFANALLPSVPDGATVASHDHHGLPGFDYVLEPSLRHQPLRTLYKINVTTTTPIGLHNPSPAIKTGPMHHSPDLLVIIRTGHRPRIPVGRRTSPMIGPLLVLYLSLPSKTGPTVWWEIRLNRLMASVLPIRQSGSIHLIFQPSPPPSGTTYYQTYHSLLF